MDKNKACEYYGCPHLSNSMGNYVECKLYSQKHSHELGHMFVDWFYWNSGAPDECPLKMAEQKYSIKTFTPQQRRLLNEIRKETEAPYRNIIDGIRKYGNDRNKVINYLWEIAIVYA